MHQKRHFTGQFAGRRETSVQAEFCKNLGISVITVENAYEQLIAEGYIYSMPKRGFYVTDFKGVLESKQREEVQEIIP